MSVQKAKKYLEKYNLENEVIELKETTATVKDAANALKCEEGDIAKTLSFIVNDKPILIVTSGNYKIINSKFKQEFKTKAVMIPFNDVENLVGYAPGGVCPFGVNNGVDIYLDVSLKEHDYIYPACGSSNSAIKLTLEQIEKIVDYKKWIDVCKKIEL